MTPEASQNVVNCHDDKEATTAGDAGFVFGVMLVVCVFFQAWRHHLPIKTASKKQPQPNKGLYCLRLNTRPTMARHNHPN